MIEQLIENIVEAENQAEDIVKGSVIQAKQIVAAAQEQAKTMIEQAKVTVKQNLVDATNQAGVKAEKLYIKTIEDGKVDAEQMVIDAQKNQKKAVDYIIRSYKAKYGDC